MADLSNRASATTDPEVEAHAPNGWPRELLRGFKAGERQALTQVYRLHAEDVAQLLRRGFRFETGGRWRRFVGYDSAFELQDALHETFRRAFEPRARAGYDGIRPYGPYVATIARNLVLRSFRAREISFPLADEPSGSPTTVQAIDERNDPEREVHDRQVRELVARFLEGLDEAHRRLIELRFVQGLSQRDAAKDLGVGRQWVRTHEDKLRRQLLEFLREQGESTLLDGAVACLGMPALAGGDLLQLISEVLR